jgi:hypothetical protein
MQQRRTNQRKDVEYRLADMHTPPQGLELSLVRKGQAILK